MDICSVRVISNQPITWEYLSAFRLVDVVKATTHYYQGVQKSISERTARHTLNQMGYSSRRLHLMSLLWLRTGN